MAAPLLNLIGAGHAGRTLARLWHAAGTFRIAQVRTRRLETARSAVAFIGAGEAIGPMAAMAPADWWLIATGDDAIAGAARDLAAADIVRPADHVFHLSGALDAGTLAPLAEAGARRLASAHPVHSFADPARSVDRFAGSWCALEGEPDTVDGLAEAFAAIGAETFRLAGGDKLLYHAGSVFACNYLVALLEAGLKAFAAAGVPRELAAKVLSPLVHGTVDNALAGAPGEALTGPIARGEQGLVQRQYAAVAEHLGADHAAAYAIMGRLTTALAAARGTAPADALDAIHRSLMQPPGTGRSG